MNCPFCQHSDTKVLDSRPDQNGQSIRRRRECLACERRWRTLERIEDEMPIVLKRNGTHEPFVREKLLQSMRTACSKRPVSIGQLEQALADIEWSFLERGGSDLPSIEIGERVMNALRGLDEIAYIRYASVYRRFKDVGELMEEMQSIVHHSPVSQSSSGTQSSSQSSVYSSGPSVISSSNPAPQASVLSSVHSADAEVPGPLDLFSGTLSSKASSSDRRS